MKNVTSTNFKKDLSNLLKARFPYIYIPTWEEERVISVINSVISDELLIKTKRKLFTWTLTQGIVSDTEGMVSETRDPIKALEFVEKYSESSVFVFKDFHIYFGTQLKPNGEPEVIRKIRDILPYLKKSTKPKNIVFVSPSLILANDIQKDVTILEFNLPTADEIKALLDEMIEVNKYSGRINIALSENEKERLAKAALGLTHQEAENSFARAMVEDGCLNADDVEVILEEKCQVIKKTGILEFIKSDLNIDDVGGLQNLKRWLIKRNKSWLDVAKRYCLPSPKGVLITGIPGCGKSLIAKSVSAMWQLPLLRLDVGKIFNGVVGSSEENMRRAIKTAEAVAPSILWIDEIEKGFGGIGSNGDSGTSTRIFGTFLTWMQEKTAPVFVVATANNINTLPPELLRKGRFDEIFFVDLPTNRERMDIFKLHLGKRFKDKDVIGDFEINEQVLKQLSDLTEGFVGAEIEQIVISALFEAFYEDRRIRYEDLEKSIKNTVPLSITQSEQIKNIREWANIRAVAATPREDRAEYIKNIEKKDKSDDPKKETTPIEDIGSTRGGRAIDF